MTSLKLPPTFSFSCSSHSLHRFLSPSPASHLLHSKHHSCLLKRLRRPGPGPGPRRLSRRSVPSLSPPGRGLHFRAGLMEPQIQIQSQIQSQSQSQSQTSKYPVLLLDVMGTLVRDPFYDDVPAFFGISMKELLATKHPTAWIEFEKGLITEDELICKFFKDKREFDSNGLKACMANGYSYLEGIEALLDRLKTRGYQIHAFSNYPLWYELIEEKLKLSRYLDWTFVSCHMGKRKPDVDAFVEVTRRLGLNPSNIIFVDDQSRNVEAAIEIGMIGLNFQSAKKLENDLLSLGLLL